MRVRIGAREVGEGQPCYVVAEIGQNHNGDIGTAIRLIRAAQQAGADAVKFQKRTVELAVPPEQQGVMRDTPWGRMTYLDYRRRLEFGRAEYDAIDAECRRLGIPWFASAWDLPSLDFLLAYDTPATKIPSACLTDDGLLLAAAGPGRPVILSTGMSTPEQIEHAVDVVLEPECDADLVLLHCTSTYPCPAEELNLLCINTLLMEYGAEAVIGFSSHSQGVWAPQAAMVLGAALVEVHFTLDRAMWGTDQAASLEPAGLARVVRFARRWEAARGDGVKRVYDSERPVMARLRRIG